MDPAEPIRTAVRQYGRARDPLEKLAALVRVQREAGPALAAVVDECREHGNEWDAIASVLGLHRASVYRQHRAGAIQAGAEREELSA